MDVEGSTSAKSQLEVEELRRCRTRALAWGTVKVLLPGVHVNVQVVGGRRLRGYKRTQMHMQYAVCPDSEEWSCTRLIA